MLDKEAIPCVGLIGLHCLAILQRSELVRFSWKFLRGVCMLALGLRDIVVIETIPCAGLIINIPFRSCSAMNGLGSVG
jgi:hypothetical protein